MAKVTTNNWLSAGLDILIAAGRGGLTIDHLCRHLGMTKGSFYHHFKNLAEYEEKLLNFWEEDNTFRIVQGIQNQKKQTSFIDGLINTLANESDSRAAAEIALRAWTLKDKRVSVCIERIDGYRLSLLQDYFNKTTKDKRLANLMATLLHTILVGCYSVKPPVKGMQLLKLYQDFKKLCHLD